MEVNSCNYQGKAFILSQQHPQQGSLLYILRAGVPFSRKPKMLPLVHQCSCTLKGEPKEYAFLQTRGARGLQDSLIQRKQFKVVGALHDLPHSQDPAIKSLRGVTKEDEKPLLPTNKIPLPCPRLTSQSLSEPIICAAGLCSSALPQLGSRFPTCF